MVDGVPAELLIGITNLERLQATLDLGGQLADFVVNGKFVTI